MADGDLGKLLEYMRQLRDQPDGSISREDLCSVMAGLEAAMDGGKGGEDVISKVEHWFYPFRVPNAEAERYDLRDVAVALGDDGASVSDIERMLRQMEVSVDTTIGEYDQFKLQFSWAPGEFEWLSTSPMTVAEMLSGSIEFYLDEFDGREGKAFNGLLRGLTNLRGSVDGMIASVRERMAELEVAAEVEPEKADENNEADL